MRCARARRSVLVVVHAACAVGFSFVVLTFLCPTATWFWRIEQKNAHEHIRSILSCTAYDTRVACLRKTKGARDSLYSTRLRPSSHSVVDASAGHSALRGLTPNEVISDQNTRTTLFFAAARLSRTFISPEDPNNVTKFKSSRNLTKRQLERHSFSQNYRRIFTTTNVNPRRFNSARLPRPRFVRSTRRDAFRPIYDKNSPEILVANDKSRCAKLVRAMPSLSTTKNITQQTEAPDRPLTCRAAFQRKILFNLIVQSASTSAAGIE